AAVSIAQKLIRRFRHPLKVDELTLPVSISVGVALYPRDAADTGSWYDRADAALYAAKRYGKGRAAFYAPGMTAGPCQQSPRAAKVD
ncbi:MAG: diguanylate cyclase, partial [Pseudomonadota bacterium]